MLMTYSQRPRGPLGFGKRVASAVSALIAVVIWSGLVSPAGGEGRVAVPPYDRGVLSEIARDVLRRGATGGNQSVPESTSPMGEAEEEVAVVESAPGAPSRPPRTSPPARGHHRPDSAHVLGVKEGASEGGDHQLSLQLVAAAPGHPARAQLLVGCPRPGLRARPRAKRPRRRPARAGPAVRVRLSPATGPPRRGARKEVGRPRGGASRSPRRPPEGPPAGRIARGDRKAGRGRVGRGERAAAEAELGADHASGLSRGGGRCRPRDADPDRHQSLRG